MSVSARAHSSGIRSGSKKNARRQSGIIWLAVGLLVFVVLALLISLRSGASMGTTPDFTGTTMNGESVRLSDYRGQVVLLNFWATWCPPCRAEMPSIETAYERYQDKGFAVLAINNSESMAQIAPFASMLGLRFPVVLDTDARLQRAFGITGYPTSIFIGRDGEIFATHVGMLDPIQLTAYIETGMEADEQTS